MLSLLLTYGASPNSMSYYGVLVEVAATINVTPKLATSCFFFAERIMDVLGTLSTEDVVAMARGLLEGKPELKRKETF